MNRTFLFAVLLVMSVAGPARAGILITPPADEGTCSMTFNSNLQGWVNSAGFGNGGANGHNTFTGNEFGARFNSWASFSLPASSGTVVTASLQLPLLRYPFQNPDQQTVGVNDVDTPLASFVSSTSGVNGYNDLGTGNPYGTVTGANEIHTVVLSAQAVADINAAIGGDFILGFTNLTLNPLDPNGVDIGIYTNGLTANNPQLILEMTGCAVPEPAGITVLAIGITSLGVCAGVRRRRMAANPLK